MPAERGQRGLNVTVPAMLIAEVLTGFDLEMPRTEPLGDLAALMRSAHLPAVSVALIEDGWITDTLALGELRHGSADPVTPETAFQAASISKPIAAFCVLRLVADGVLDLDADVNDMLRTWRVPANGDWQPVVTLRQLLSHTAGTTTHGFLGYPEGHAIPSVPDILDGLGNSDPVRVSALPGTRFRYSGGGYTIVQQLLSDVTGRAYADLARELVLDHLGMTHSAFDDGHRPGYATGHQGGPSPIPGGAHRYPELAAAGLWTTPTDLARFLFAVNACRRGDPMAPLSKELGQAMITPVADGPYGLGLQVGEDGEWFGHNGGNEGFLSLARLHPASGSGVVIMTNGVFGMLVINQYLLPKLAAAMNWPDAPPEPEPSEPSEPATAGRYGDFVIEVRDGGLVLRAPGQPAIGLTATGHGWRATALNLDVRFAGGELIISQDGVLSDVRVPRAASSP